MLTRARVSVGTKERGMEWKSRRAGLAASTAHKKTPPTDDTRARHPREIAGYFVIAARR
jgi:hypothetical protein